MPEIVRVLVVDDSAYVRKVVSQMLGRSPFIEVVGAARDGEEALGLVQELRPDVVTCDLNMPVMDGVSFVRAQMARRPIPIIIISIAAESGEQVLAALDAGAIDFVQKPTALATERLMDMADELIDKVKAAARSPRRSVVAREPRAGRSTSSSSAFRPAGRKGSRCWCRNCRPTARCRWRW
jgi:two-component system chemotaxis response regulator CheB